ncbi:MULTISPECIES: hypothetical protein [unclassified Mesorhizobium]|uniref:hypothetical protein n=1 Tax=unclassified Mesorhizobium TaxID=325217 RepID=UPI0033366C20
MARPASKHSRQNSALRLPERQLRRAGRNLAKPLLFIDTGSDHHLFNVIVEIQDKLDSLFAGMSVAVVISIHAKLPTVANDLLSALAYSLFDMT